MKTIFITNEGPFWKTHTDDKIIKRACLLKSVAEAAALKFVSEKPAGEYHQIVVKERRGERVLWSYASDGFPPAPLTKHAENKKAV